MNRRLSLVILAAAAGCTARNVRKAEAENPPYVFPHQPHVENDVACTNCHASIKNATKLEAKVRHIQIPARSEVCAACHDQIPKLSIPARSLEFELEFDHAAHLPRVNGDCKRCHKELPEQGEKEPVAPPMAACTACHNHQRDFAEARCSPCHKDLRSYELKPVSTFAHVGDWLANHGALARPSARACAACHDQTYCADCHSAATAPTRQAIRWPEEVESDFIHRGDYVSRHMIDAGAQPASCRRCHGSPFCQSCHELQNVASLGLPTDRDPHPKGGAWLTKGSGQFHGDAARANIVACAACHDQGAGAICATCHKGINPHPPGWSSRHSESEQHSKKVCQICHGP